MNYEMNPEFEGEGFAGAEVCTDYDAEMRDKDEARYALQTAVSSAIRSGLTPKQIAREIMNGLQWNSIEAFLVSSEMSVPSKHNTLK